MSKRITLVFALVFAMCLAGISVGAADAGLPLSGMPAPDGSVLLTKEFPYEFGSYNQGPKLYTSCSMDMLFDQIAPAEGEHFWGNVTQAGSPGYAIIGYVVFDKPMVLTEVRVKYSVWPEGFTMPNTGTGSDPDRWPDLLGMRTWNYWATVEPGDSDCLKHISVVYTDEDHLNGDWVFNPSGTDLVDVADDTDGDGWIVIPESLLSAGGKNVGTGFGLNFTPHLDLDYGGDVFISEIEYYGYPLPQEDMSSQPEGTSDVISGDDSETLENGESAVPVNSSASVTNRTDDGSDGLKDNIEHDKSKSGPVWLWAVIICIVLALVAVAVILSVRKKKSQIGK